MAWPDQSGNCSLRRIVACPSRIANLQTNSGCSDAGISAAQRIRELDPTTDVTVVVADACPNFSICGIPYYVRRGHPLGNLAASHRR